MTEHGTLAESAALDFGSLSEAEVLRRLPEFTLDADFIRSSIEQSGRVFIAFSIDATKTLYVSPKFDEIWGCSRQRLYDSPSFWHETLHPDDRESVARLAQTYFENATHPHPPLEYRIVRPDGEVRWLWGYLFHCRDAALGLRFMGGIAEDVTFAKASALEKERARNELEATVAARTAELTRLNEALRREIKQRVETEDRLKAQHGFLKKVLQVQELERKFISHDIHDGTVQSVIAANMHLDSALSTASFDETVSRELREAHRLLGEVLAETRRMIAGIRPATLDDLGVAAAIEGLVVENAHHGLNVVFVNGIGDRRWSPAIEMTIYRIVQESLSNVRRHGNTEQADIEIQCTAERITVTVTDRGRGFDVAAAADGEFGLRGIRERATAIGGNADIKSVIGKGTIVSAVLPTLDPAEAASVERARAEAALRKSKERLQAILDRTSTVIFVKDHLGRYELVNNRFEELFHVDRRTFLGKSPYDLYPPEVADSLMANDRAVRAEGVPITVEETVPTNGELRSYLAVKFLIPGAEGPESSLCGIATDITERKRELRELTESRSRFQSFMDHVPMLAWLKDSDGRYVYVNQCFYGVLKFREEQVIGHDDFALFAHDVATAVRQHDLEVLQTGQAHRYLESAPVGSSSPVVWESFKFPVAAGDGSIMVGGVAFDATRPFSPCDYDKSAEKP
ncbi:MAG: PAS domain-containing protein [Planctomycetia bacterium]|nr:PAS domain-containing protein [Planctomycetia bacterium]